MRLSGSAGQRVSGSAARRLGGSAAGVGAGGGCLPARRARPPCRSRCAAKRRAAGAPCGSCAPVFLCLFSSAAASLLAHNSNTPTARARVRFRERATCARRRRMRSTHSPPPPPRPPPLHTNTTEGAAAALRLRFEARRAVLFPAPHRCAARPFFGDGPPGVRTFSLSQPSGPHAAWAATITRAKRHIDFIILSVGRRICFCGDFCFLPRNLAIWFL